MRTPRMVILPLCVSVLALSAVACGDDDDDGDALSDEDYFAEVDLLKRDFDAVIDVDVFAANLAPDAAIDAFVEAADQFAEGLRDLKPPEDIEDAHVNYLKEVDAVVDFVPQAAEDADPGPFGVGLHTLLFAEGSPYRLSQVSEAQCELVDVAEEKGIELAFLACGQPEGVEAAGIEDAGDNPVIVEAVDFDFNFDGGEFTPETTGVILLNHGQLVHELRLSRCGDGSIDSLVACYTQGTEYLAETFAEPGAEAGVGFEEPLAPGRLFAACYVEDPFLGQLYVELGMAYEFVVD